VPLSFQANTRGTPDMPALYDRIFMGGVAAVKKFRPSNREVKVVQR